MKIKIRLLVSGILLTLLCVYCSNDDDICTSGEATPRLKMKFRTSEGKEKTLDSLYLNVVYGSGEKTVIKAADVDSVLIPLRVDDQLSTEFTVRLNSNGPESRIKLNYTTESQYVSPACGIKRLYKNLDPVIENTDPVEEIIKVQNEITSEEKSHLYLVF